MVIFDTNAVLRYILQDNQEMADSVEQQLSKNICYIPVEVVAEIVYVLLKVYHIGRTIIAQTIVDLTDTDNIIVAQSDVVRHAMGVFAASKLDFVDCLLIGYAREKQYSVFTFDKKLQNHLDKI